MLIWTIGIVGLIIMIVSFVGWYFLNFDKDDHWAPKPITWIIPILGVVIFIFGLGSPVQVSAGERGILFNGGKTTSITYDEGLYWKMPFINTVKKVDVTVQRLVVEAGAATRDTQDAFITITVNYRLDPLRVNPTYQRFRGQEQAILIIPQSQEAIKTASVEYDAENLVANRPLLREHAVEILGSILEPNGMLLEAIAIENISFTEEFQATLESRAQAKIQIQTAEYEKDRAIVQAETAEEQAKGRANAAIAESIGESTSIKNIADADAYRNEVINASLTPDLIRYLTVDQLADDINTIILPSGEEFILGPEVLGR